MTKKHKKRQETSSYDCEEVYTDLVVNPVARRTRLKECGAGSITGAKKYAQ